MTQDFWLKNVLTEVGFHQNETYIDRTDTKLIHLHIKDGIFSEIIEDVTLIPQNSQQIDGGGQLLTPALVEKHCHLDKSKLGVPWEPITPAKNIVERFESEIVALNHLDLPLKERAKNLLDLEVQHGVTFFRSHIDVHPKVGLSYLEQVIDTLNRYDKKVGYELVAFPQHGLLRTQSQQLMKDALRNGATFVGGVDPATVDNDLEGSLMTTFDVATEFNAPIDIHLHNRDDAGRETIRRIIQLTKESQLQGKVFISHAFGLNDFVGEERQEVFTALAKQNIGIVSSVPITPNTIPPLMELKGYGVNVHLGCDNIYDSWSPYGTGNLSDKLARFGEIAGLTSQEQLTQALGLITNHQTALDEQGNVNWPKVGDAATFLLTTASCSAEFVARQTPVTLSYHKGNKIL